MDPAHGDQPDRLEDDQKEVTSTDARGVIRWSAHYYDWEGIDWHVDNGGVDRGHSVVYWDMTWAAPVSDVPWLLMEPVSHEVRRRSWVCFLNSHFSQFTTHLRMYVIKLCMLVLVYFESIYASHECT